ncbi:DUF1553 domain-containing protein [Cyclobacterium marinum]|uniref:Cytochrome c domain-containing protein n=1 Tax=Cyclobacterium marinum (strain ATCC 25205 / DSM 745 / LMG 13164 / NCIMB 1802) TaxID=880070 RepID=G0J2D7_CYCMS|nr:DUF1553 domain-containing protein [Cyclobacterium marinum]AEL25211.1 protein of unknown function DUF1549 [Cyclobacterium marinum DSM 745]
MKSRFLLFILPVLLLLTFWLWPRQEKISYNRQIRPIINNKCISCHGGVKQSGGFSLLFEEEAKMDTESGKPAIIPGDAEASEMVTRLTHHDPELRMPLGKDPLSNEEINLIKEWINQGANWEKHWAYIPPAKDIEVPTVDMEIPAQNEIDHFIFRQLAKMELSPNEEAPKELLLRRLTLDITGLPPDIQAYDDFIADTSPNAYENKVDQLLASPHFGEKWAAFWMDLARYSDSKGYEKDLHREIWKYRDWLIEAFNQDMPFDQFTIAQLAGDLLPDPTESDLLATAFHRNTMANDEGGTNDEEFRVAAVMERVGTTFEVWQGITMACVQCHSHPYDPIRHEEFYKSQAFFNNTQDKDLYNEQPKVFTYEKEDEQKVKELLSWVNENLRPSEKLPKITDRFLHKQKQELLYSLGFRKVEAEEFQDKSRFIELVAHDQESIWQVQDSSWIMFENVDLTDISAISLGYASLYGAKVEIRLDSVLGEKIGEGTFRITDKNFPGNRPTDWETLKVSIKPVSGTRDIFYYFKKDQTFAQDLIRVDWVFYHEKAPLKDKYPPSLQAKLEELSNTKAIETPILKDLPKSRSRKTHVFERGDWRSKGEEVRANTPEIMGTINKDNPTRLDFAKWLVNGENSLTSRVIVNRIWEQIFGFGIVESMEDFGSQGIPASHPELLDWLAVNFQDDMNWSMKKLIKKIVMSQSYRQNSATDEHKIKKDPYNKFLSRGSRTRLPAETIRDQALAISGLLNEKQLGPSVMPYQPENIISFGGKFWFPSEGDEKYRRAVYTYWKRTHPYPSFVTFDSPSREVCTSRRIRTNTPLQSLVLLNDPVYIEAADAWAKRILKESGNNIKNGIEKNLRLVTAKVPEPEKVEVLHQLYLESLSYYQKEGKELDKNAELAAMRMVSNAMLNLDEFVTRR